MASAAPPHDVPLRSWWSMKNQSQRYLPEKQKSKSPLGSLASAFGLKSKKSPTLTIEDPPLPIQSPPPPPPVSPVSPKPASRPPSKSVSSTLSRADSAGPLTPSDVHHNPARHSLLTLSDTDPFAGRSGVTIASPTDPTRLSAYSNSSIQDYAKPGDHQHHPGDRISYASSSSQSQSHANVGGAELKRTLSPLSPTDSYTNRRLLKKLSETNLGRANSTTDKIVRQSPVLPSHTLHKSGSTNTLHSSAYGPPVKRPALRPRGMTDNCALPQKAGFFVDASSKSAVSSPVHSPTSPVKPLSPRVVIRQASQQRLTPPAAPPRHGLPATPHWPVREDEDPNYLAPAVSTASSTISFASSTSSRDLFPASPVLPPERPRRISERSFFMSGVSEVDKTTPERPSAPQTPASTQSTLKKALSHQSLRKRAGLFSSSSPSNAAPPETEKTPQKHRVFPHPRIPIPPIPISLRPSTSSNSGGAESNASSTTEQQKRGSSSSGRKRLFSGSSLRRPSTSHSHQPDDDTQSVFSVKSDQDMYINGAFFKPWISTQTTNASFWEEAAPETAPNSPTRTHTDFSAQQQTSPKAPLRKLDIGSPPRKPRGNSIRSTDTSFSASDKYSEGAFVQYNTTAPLRLLGRSNTLSRSKPDVTTPTTAATRPATATPLVQPKDEEEAVPDPIEHNYKPSVSPPPLITSLPPPPRRNRAAVIVQPEPEPAPKPQPEPAVADSPPSPVASLPLPPPPPNRSPRLNSRPPVSIEKALHRRSIMKKPSFLEIDDDESDDDEGDDDVVVYRKDIRSKDIGDSFLDFARESFDTVRST